MAGQIYPNPQTPAHLRYVLAQLQSTNGGFIAQEDLDNYNTESVEAAEDGSAGDLVYYSASGVISLARADADATARPVGMLLDDVLTGGTVRILVAGIVTIAGAALTPGTRYWLSPTVAGGITSTPPSADGHYVIMVGRATTATHFALNIEDRILL